MTEQEAIYCMKAVSERYSHVCEECPLYGETGCDHCYDDANDMAIKALEKQIPKEPIDRCMFKECPSCHEIEIQYCNYCPTCGQKLNWEEV